MFHDCSCIHDRPVMLFIITVHMQKRRYTCIPLVCTFSADDKSHGKHIVRARQDSETGREDPSDVGETKRECIDWFAVPSRRSGYVFLGKSATCASNKSSTHSEAERPSIRSKARLVSTAYDNVYYQRIPVVRGAEERSQMNKTFPCLKTSNSAPNERCLLL